MTAPVEIKISRGELFTDDVDKALARQRSLEGRTLPAPEPVSLLRRVLLSSMFYLPLAGLAGAFGAWMLIEPMMGDQHRVAGEVVLINTDAFDTNGRVSMTIGNKEVLIDQRNYYVVPGKRGQPMFKGLDDVHVGTVVEVVADNDAVDNNRIVAMAIRPSTAEDAAAVTREVEGESRYAALALFPVTGTFIALALLISEGISRRNWSRMIERVLTGTLLAALFSVLAAMVGGIVFKHVSDIYQENPASKLALMALITSRSVAWACVGAGLGAGMNLTRTTPAELRNAVVGGALGGAFGGIFFDPIDFLSRRDMFQQAELSRAVGLCTIGIAVGLFVSLLERLTREAWIRVRTGPLAGKSFILYRSPTVVGSSPSSDIYLFKDAGIDPMHARIHRVGQMFEIEDMGSREGTIVGAETVRRRRLRSGDQITVGSTIIEFEERERRADAMGGKKS